MCHMSRVMCHLSAVILLLFFFILKKILLSGGASLWRVCYQRGLSGLVLYDEPYCDEQGVGVTAREQSVLHTCGQTF